MMPDMANLSLRLSCSGTFAFCRAGSLKKSSPPSSSSSSELFFKSRFFLPSSTTSEVYLVRDDLAEEVDCFF